VPELRRAIFFDRTDAGIFPRARVAGTGALPGVSGRAKTVIWAAFGTVMVTRAVMVMAVAATLLSTAPVFATGVLAFRTPHRVVLGADSLLTSFDGSGRVVSKSLGCKLHTSGDWIFTWGGHESGGGASNLAATFARTIADADTLTALSSAVRSFIARHIVTLDWHALRAVYPEVGDVVFWAAAGRVHDGTAELGIYRAAIASYDPLALDVVAVTCPGDCSDGWLAAGHAAERGPIAEDLASSPYPAWLARLDGAAAYRLLSAQADATPARIRRPFDVLEMTRGGTRWIDRGTDSSCPAVLGGDARASGLRAGHSRRHGRSGKPAAIAPEPHTLLRSEG
jgi:hypothetical protein